MSEEKQPISRKSSSLNGENGKDVITNNEDGGGEVTLKAKMSLVNGCTVIVGSIIGE
jgi:solute carrier family 7 (L-type amino acid transporter), member 8